MAGLEYRADLHRERLAAVLALVDANARALALHLAIALCAATVGANRAVRPDASLNEFIRGLFVVEVRGVQYGVGHLRLPVDGTIIPRTGLNASIGFLHACLFSV